jgi:L-rhamnose isomerase
MTSSTKTEKAYESARESYAEMGVDTEEALKVLEGIPISLHCWQGDDVGGFERPNAALSGGGIQVTGNHPGKARNVRELRMDLDKAFSLIPGRHRLNLHAIYGEFGSSFVDRDDIGPEHFKGWVEWARSKGLKLDFNASCFSHPKADSGFTLSSKDAGIRDFWIQHVQRCREIGAYMGKEQKSPCIHNLWIPDGCKDTPQDRWSHRSILTNALDEIFSKKFSAEHMKDSVESKLFGIGSESFVVGSHEFYLGYALSRKKMVCLDLGHFHPTESVSDKISAVLPFFPELLLHVSRGVRWDSDHVVILNDDLLQIAEEVVRGQVLKRVHVALDFFDATLNRIGAWVVGTRATLKAFLAALLEPGRALLEAEEKGDLFTRLALREEVKTLPLGAVWDYYCLKAEIPYGEAWMEEVRRYEASVTLKRK